MSLIIQLFKVFFFLIIQLISWWTLNHLSLTLNKIIKKIIMDQWGFFYSNGNAPAVVIYCPLTKCASFYISWKIDTQTVHAHHEYK